jgi:diacylglycerol O-acyltransferase / wax synthase
MFGTAVSVKGETLGEQRRVMQARLSALDASFLQVETPTAHMHVGWAALFEPPGDRLRPSFDELRAHLGDRLPRAPRFRQRLREVPLGLSAPVWVDEPDFDLDRHLTEADSSRLSEVVDSVMSEPLPRDRPLWQMHLAPRLEDGRIAVVCKAHHCMVDGIAAVQLGSLLLDPTPETPPAEPGEWQPEGGPSQADLIVGGAIDLVRSQLALGSLPARIATSPARARDLAGRAWRAARALADSARPAPPVGALNRPISPRRHLAYLVRPLDELREIKSRFGVKLNDVVLAVATSGYRAFSAERGERPTRIKAMVPVNVRATEGEELGNRISFMFIDLPCQEPDAVRRLREIHSASDRRKRAGTPEGGDDVLGLLSYAPPPVRALFSRFVASPRTFNLVVSNIPGPLGETYLRGCRLREAYPVVPIAAGHALSIGFTSVGDHACFGFYADCESLPDVDYLAECTDTAIDELAAATPARLKSRAPAFG